MATTNGNGTGNGTAKRTTLGVTAETHERVNRLARLHGKPATWLIERFASVFELAWRKRMSPDEWRRYLADDVSPREAQRIMTRERAPKAPDSSDSAEEYVL